MPVLPKNLFLLGASFATARTARRLKRAHADLPAQRDALHRLTKELARTESGRSAGIEPGLAYEKFRARAPLRDYDHLTPSIERMKRGGADILWPGTCALYTTSSGAGGRVKTLPVTEQMLGHLRRASRLSLLFYTARAGHSGVFRGRHLSLGGSTLLAPIAEAKPFAAFSGDFAAIMALNLPSSAERHLYEPGAAIGGLEDWSKKIDAIVARTRHLDITLLAGMPSWLLTLAAAFRESSAHRTSGDSLQAFWPNLECILHGGVALAPYHDELRRVAGPQVNFHEVYSAPEGVIAAQDGDASAGLRLLTGSGLFFEFLPLADYDPALPAATAQKTLPLEQVRAGDDYVLVVTTPAGLSRYIVGDIVRFVSTEPPRIVLVGQVDLRLRAFGENVSEKDLVDCLVAVCARHDWNIGNFHVAPVIASSRTGQKRGHHEWWIELRPGTVETPTGPLLALELDREMIVRVEGYAAKRKAGTLDAAQVRLVMPGLFEHWMRHHGKWGGQYKFPTSRNDRQIADELAGLACFNAD